MMPAPEGRVTPPRAPEIFHCYGIPSNVVADTMFLLKNPTINGNGGRDWTDDLHARLWSSLRGANPRLIAFAHIPGVKSTEHSFAEIAIANGLVLTIDAMQAKDPNFRLSEEELAELIDNAQRNYNSGGIISGQNVVEALMRVKTRTHGGRPTPADEEAHRNRTWR
jgi:hypothetical protein